MTETRPSSRYIREVLAPQLRQDMRILNIQPPLYHGHYDLISGRVHAEMCAGKEQDLRILGRYGKAIRNMVQDRRLGRTRWKWEKD